MIDKNRIIENIRNPISRFFTKIGYPLIDRILKISEFEEGCTQLTEDFFGSSLDVLNLEYECSNYSYSRIPENGPVVIVSNHPHGGIDGLILGHLIGRVRPDFKFLANHLLGKVTLLKRWIIESDPFSSNNRKNLLAVKQTLSWMRDNHALIVFPAGEVSSIHHWEVQDGQWLKTVARLVLRSHASVLPIFIHGHNSWLFLLAGLISPKLRTMLLIREMMNKKGKRIKISINELIPWRKLKLYKSPERVTKLLWDETYSLKV